MLDEGCLGAGLLVWLLWERLPLSCSVFFAGWASRSLSSAGHVSLEPASQGGTTLATAFLLTARSRRCSCWMLGRCSPPWGTDPSLQPQRNLLTTTGQAASRIQTCSPRVGITPLPSQKLCSMLLTVSGSRRAPGSERELRARPGTPSTANCPDGASLVSSPLLLPALLDPLALDHLPWP